MLQITPTNGFAERHLGPDTLETDAMLRAIGVDSIDALIDETIPANIRLESALNLPEPMTEHEYLQHAKAISERNKVFKSYIGMGYYGTITPSVILRNVFENPGWYTQYTPYQAEIAQGRLESLLNFQTMVSDLTGMSVANASLLDEATAAAEAMSLFFHHKNKGKAIANVIWVSDTVFPQTIDVLFARAEPLGIDVKVAPVSEWNLTETTFAAMVQYPDSNGEVAQYQALADKIHAVDAYLIAAADILSLAILVPPGEWGADAAVGNTQRFGVPMGYGGPHAAYFATGEAFKRQIPGRIIGVSIDSHGKPALRMALQTREQHIRREKATSNICTAQALLANMAGFYATYHGPEGIKNIAQRTHNLTVVLSHILAKNDFAIVNKNFFDTITIATKKDITIGKKAESMGMNFRYGNNLVHLSLDETTCASDLVNILAAFGIITTETEIHATAQQISSPLHAALHRKTAYLTHPIFNSHHSESKMMRYLKTLENKDLSLVHSMISLGSCTMKLNAATEMMPLSWAGFSSIHPFAPVNQAAGYHQIFEELDAYLCEITGFTACSLQPNSGAQGEYSGLLAIRNYHQANGDTYRNIALIPASAHGTNPASAVMAGMQVVVTKCDEAGNIDVTDLREKAELHKANLAALMVTYPSTHGVFETSIIEICDLIHECGGLVYMDGANMNAQVGLTSPARIGADVCHLNLHKTFAIPHGGGGPGMGPICVNDKLKPYLPGHSVTDNGYKMRAVSAAPWGSASILLISYAYIRMLGAKGVTDATKYAILNSNYIKTRLENDYTILYLGEKGRTAHELIVDLRPYKVLGIEAEDVAKRLIDYGFHAPTMSFPVAGTIMIEPTESEDKAEIDRFCDALIQIKAEINEIASGEADKVQNVLKNAPHIAAIITNDEWNLPYSREKAAYPLPWVAKNKFWATVGRINNAFGDRNVICTCPPMQEYA